MSRPASICVPVPSAVLDDESLAVSRDMMALLVVEMRISNITGLAVLKLKPLLYLLVSHEGFCRVTLGVGSRIEVIVEVDNVTLSIVTAEIRNVELSVELESYVEW